MKKITGLGKAFPRNRTLWLHPENPMTLWLIALGIPWPKPYQMTGG